MVKKIIIFFIAFFFVKFSISQNPIFLETNAKYSFIFPHHPEIRTLITQHIWSYNGRIGIQTFGKKQWQKLWNNPYLGLGFYYANHGNDTLGKAYALYYFTDIPFFINNLYELSLEFGIGGTYLSRPFSLDNNIYNFVNGSKFNIFADLKLKNQIRFGKIAAILAVSLTHYSNGGTKMPNLGLNLVGLNFGLRYFASNKAKRFDKPIRYSDFKKTNFSIASTFGVQQKFITEPQFLVSNLFISYEYQKFFKTKFFIGSDFTYNKRAEYIDKDTAYSAVQIAPSMGIAFVFNKVDFFIKNSYRVKKISDDFSFYQNFGFKAEVYKGMFLTASLNTHWFNAQYIEFGFGFNLRKKRR